jgi:hypothetical protein
MKEAIRDIRVLSEATPEARMAAACMIVCRRIHALRQGCPDYADFRDEISKHLRRELLLARLDECLTFHEAERTRRSTELLAAIAEIIHE